MIFGDRNEVRSFTDIWEGGMPGYLVWLNARLYEMKRLLRNRGSILVHLDSHAVHYVKVELDKIFGSGGKDSKEPGFKNEIIWCKNTTYYQSTSRFVPQHDTILWYSKSGFPHYCYNWKSVSDKFSEVTIKKYKHVDKDGRRFRLHGRNLKGSPIQNATDVGIEWLEKAPELCRVDYLDEKVGVKPKDWWVMDIINQSANERIGYPTQKPEELLEKVVNGFSDEGDIVADFFSGGGTTPAVAQRLNRRWVACDQSRIAVAVTADRIARVVEDKIGKLFPVPDFTVEHWGIYESPKLEKLTNNEFREFVVKAFGGKPESVSRNIHGVRHGVPLYVGEPSRASRITKDEVAKFAQAIFKERHTNFGAMLAWNFSPDARKAAEILAARENKRIDFVRLNLVRLEDEAFSEHVVTKHKDYGELLSFIKPPEVRIALERIGKLKYQFDVSESVSLNKDGIIANVQWDFDYRGRFSSSEGFAFLRDKKTGRPLLVVEYDFPSAGKKKIACSVQDDQGGERTVTMEIEVK